MKPDSLIKADSANAPTPVPFRFDDVRALAAKILQRANEQAQRKLDAAGKQAGEMEQVAFQDGYDKGHKEGYAKGETEGRAAGEQAAREAFREKTQAVAERLEALLSELQARKVALRSQAEADLLRLAVGVARRVVRREIAVDERFVIPLLREAVGLAADRSDLTVRAHPEDAAAVEAELPALRAAFTDLGRVHLEPDASLQRGELRLAGREGEVDMRLERQFEAIERALLGIGAKEDDIGTEGDRAAAADRGETILPAGDGAETDSGEAALPAPDEAEADSPAEAAPEADASAPDEAGGNAAPAADPDGPAQAEDPGERPQSGADPS